MNRDQNAFTSLRQRIKPGLYALTPATLTGPALLDQSEAVLRGGPRMLQYRAKPRADFDTALALKELCSAYEVMLIINDDVELARSVQADGVHLGRDDMSLEQARQQLSEDQIIGVSCYNDLTRARRLSNQGADYLAFGSLYPSPTKPDAVRCSLSILNQARELGKPLVAIGGVRLEHAPQVIAAGADLIAVISDLFDASDVRSRAQAWSDCFASQQPDE